MLFRYNGPEGPISASVVSLPHHRCNSGQLAAVMAFGAP